MEAFEGHWTQIKSSDFDDYLKACGVSFLLRKVAGASSPAVEFRNNGDGTWTFFFYSTVKNGQWTFKVGEESEETTPDGRKYMSTITVDADGVLTHYQRATKKGDNDSIIKRRVIGDELHTTCECAGVSCTAVDKKQ